MRREIISGYRALYVRICFIRLRRRRHREGDGGGGADELLLGGDTTVSDASSQAFTFPATGLSEAGVIET